jgi:hypothetical protein
MNAKTIIMQQAVGGKDFLRVLALPATTTRASDLPGVGLLAGSRRWALIRMGFRAIPFFVILFVIMYVWITMSLIIVIIGLLLMNQGVGAAHLKAKSPQARRGLRALAVNEGLVDEEVVRGLKVLSTKKDEFGVTKKIKAPGSTTEAWRKKSDVLAGKFGVPALLFDISQDPTDPPNVFSMWIGKQGGRSTRTALVPQAADFHADFRIGQSVAGISVLASIFEFNTLIGGIPGMGKTATVRQFILHNLLDPAGRTYLVDGKGSKKDYQDALHAYSGYVNGTDDDAAEQILMLLEEIHRMVNEANGNDSRLKILLVLDEWQDIRAGCDKDMLKAIDTLIIRIHKKGRATGLHLLLATQRASAISIPTEMRSLFRQALAMRQKNGTDYGMVLGHSPDVAEPTGPGEAIFSGDRGQQFVLVDHLSQEAWLSAAQRLSPRDSLRLTVTHESDPLTQAVQAAAHRLTKDEVRLIEPSALYDLLDADVRPSNVAALGKWLAGQGLAKQGRAYAVADLRRLS